MTALYFSATVAILIHFFRSRDRRLLLLDLLLALRAVSLFLGDGTWSTVADFGTAATALVLGYTLAPRNQGSAARL